MPWNAVPLHAFLIKHFEIEGQAVIELGFKCHFGFTSQVRLSFDYFKRHTLRQSLALEQMVL